MIDKKLNWMEHIKCISRKNAKGIGIIIKSRKSFESETLLNLYNALILLHISYGIQVWGTAASIHLHRLYVLQKKIVRIFCGVHPRTHTEPLYKSLNIDQIRNYSMVLFMYKLTKHLLPPLFENMFIRTSDVHNYSKRQADLLYVQFAAIKRTQRTLKHYGNSQTSCSTSWLCNKHFLMQLEIFSPVLILYIYIYILFTILFTPNVLHPAQCTRSLLTLCL